MEKNEGFLDRGFISVKLVIFAFHHSVSFQQQCLAGVSFLLLFQHPFSQSFRLLALGKLLLFSGSFISFGFQKLFVSLLRDAFRYVRTFVLHAE